MLLRQEATHLLTTDAPIGEKHALRYQAVQLTSEGISPEMIADRLGYPLSEIEDVLNGVVDEFFS